MEGLERLLLSHTQYLIRRNSMSHSIRSLDYSQYSSMKRFRELSELKWGDEDALLFCQGNFRRYAISGDCQ